MNVPRKSTRAIFSVKDHFREVRGGSRIYNTDNNHANNGMVTQPLLIACVIWYMGWGLAFVTIPSLISFPVETLPLSLSWFVSPLCLCSAP